MKKLTKILLGGAALCALSAVPVVAGNAPKFHFIALHAGRVVNKTKMHNRGVTHVTYTYGVSTYVPASDLHKRVTLVDTFYRWSTSPCTIMATNVRAPTKSQYGRIGMAINRIRSAAFPARRNSSAIPTSSQIRMAKAKQTTSYPARYSSTQAAARGTRPP